MTLKDELSLLIDPDKNLLAGILGMTPKVVKVSNRPGFVWVRLLDNPNELIQAHNRKTSPKYDLPVWLSYDGIKYEVEGIDVNRYVWNSDNAYLPLHGMQHSAMRAGGDGTDIVWVDQTQFLPLLSLPDGYTGTANINVSPYVFRNSHGDWLYTGNTGVYIPPSSSPTGSTMYLIMLRDSDGALYTTAGTPFNGLISGTASFVQQIPKITLNKNDIPIAAIRSTSNVTGTPLLWENILDVRQFYKGFVDAPTGTAYLETIGIYNSGTFIGDASSINFVGDYVVSVNNETANIITSKPRRIVFTTEDLTYQITGSNNHFSLTGTSTTPVNVYCNLRQPPSEVTMDADMRGFLLSYVPTNNDLLIVDYMMNELFTYTVEWALVGGGGGGGYPGTTIPGGGGGGGGVIFGSMLVAEEQSFGFFVGAGGAEGVSGSHSSFMGNTAYGGFAPVNDLASPNPRTGGKSGMPTTHLGSTGRTVPFPPYNDKVFCGGGGGAGGTGTQGNLDLYSDSGGLGLYWSDVRLNLGGGGGGGVLPGGVTFGGFGTDGYGYGYGPISLIPLVQRAGDGKDGIGGGGGGGGIVAVPTTNNGGKGGSGAMLFKVPADLPILQIIGGTTYVFGQFRYYEFITPGTGTITF